MEAFSIFVLTWNIATQQPDNIKIDTIILPEILKLEAKPDLFVIGLQEVLSQPKERVTDSVHGNKWVNKFTATLSAENYIRFATRRLQGMILNLYCLQNRIPQIYDFESNIVATGFKGLSGNKGGVGMSLKFGDMSFCFITCHLPAFYGDDHLKSRIDTFKTIRDNLQFRTKVESHNCIIWLGDLNFRLKGGKQFDEIDYYIKDEQYNLLSSLDELKDLLQNDENFTKYKESNLRFKPTYKYIKNEKNYNNTRVPAYTDRILYMVDPALSNNRKMVPQFYKSNEDVIISDHRPVMALFNTQLIVHDHPVTFSDVQNWTQDKNKIYVFIDTKNTQKPPNVSKPLYKLDFQKDELSFYNVDIFKLNKPHTTVLLKDVNQSNDDQLKKKLAFNRNLLPQGNYLICYIHNGQIVGVSNRFKVL